MNQHVSIATRTGLQDLSRQTFVALTTFRKSGKPVTTPMHLVEAKGRVFFRTYNAAGKAKRLARNPDVTLAPADIRGNVHGDTLKASTHLVQGEDEALVISAMKQQYPVSQRLIPLYHKLRGWKTLHYEVIPQSASI